MDAGPGPGSLTTTSLNGNEQLDWHFLQCFGERTPGEEIQDGFISRQSSVTCRHAYVFKMNTSTYLADIISAIEFDATGQHLATGDRGGRVVLFERIAMQNRLPGMEQRPPPGRPAPCEFRYMTEFQSHEPEFDYLKSFEIEEKINKVRWVNHNSSSRCILSTNDKTIKLWKVYERKVVHLGNYNNSKDEQSWSIAAGGTASPTRLGSLPDQKAQLSIGSFKEQKPQLRIPTVTSTEVVLAAKCKKKYANAHVYHVNSIALSSDQETFITADDLRINLWHLDIEDQAFNVVDMKPPNMEELTEVITVADFHPKDCHTFAFATSKGAIRLADLRISALADESCKSFEVPEPSAANRSFFTELLASMSDLKFSRDGNCMLARDFMGLKLWDIRYESGPLATYPIHEHLKGKLGELYENDCIFDKFDCCFSGDGSHIATGTYSNSFRVVGRGIVNGAMPSSDTVLEASRDPQRKRFQQTPTKTPNRFGLSRGTSAKKPEVNGAASGSEPQNALVLTQNYDFNAKLLHLAWHPESNLIAAAASNSLYMYAAR